MRSPAPSEPPREATLLPEIFRGGIARAKQLCPNPANYEEYARILYGSSYPLRHIQDALWEVMCELAAMRNESYIDGVPHIPADYLHNNSSGVYPPDFTRALERTRKVVPCFGETALLHLDNLHIGCGITTTPAQIVRPNGKIVAALRCEPDPSMPGDIFANPRRYILPLAELAAIEPYFSDWETDS